MSWDWVDTVVTGAVGVAGIWGTLKGSAVQSKAQRDIEREARQEARLEVAYNELLLKVDQVDDWAFQLTYLRWNEKPSGLLHERLTAVNRPGFRRGSVSWLRPR